MELTKELIEYVEDYKNRVLDAFEDQLLHISTTAVAFRSPDGKKIGAHYIFMFEHKVFSTKIDMTPEQLCLLLEDDDSQPANNYRVHFGQIYVYSTRFF